MAQVQRGSRIDLLDLKAHMVKTLGPTKESQYSSLLSSFFQLKLSKAELDRLVPSTIGKENLLLHNHFVRAILHNVICGEAPPPPASFSDLSKPLKGVRRKPSTSLPGADEGPTVSAGLQQQGGRSNGDPGFTISPRKGRSVIRDRKGAERPSPLGNHRADASTGIEDGRGMENGHGAPDLLRPLQSSQQSAEQPEPWHGVSHPAKRARYEEDHVQDGNKVEGDGGAGADVEHEDEEDDDGRTIWLASSDVTVPLGIPFCRPSAGGARMAPAAPIPPGPVTLSMLGYASDDDESMENYLPSIENIRQRVQMGACLENGLEGCSTDSVHVIRAALDIYLRRILQTAVEHSQMKRSSHRESLGKDNGGASGHAEGGTALRERVASGLEGEKEDEQAQATISPLDFFVAMDLNRSNLGVNWAFLLEKISLRVFWDQYVWITFYGVREEYSGTDARVTQWQSAAGFRLHRTYWQALLCVTCTLTKQQEPGVIMINLLILNDNVFLRSLVPHPSTLHPTMTKDMQESYWLASEISV